MKKVFEKYFLGLDIGTDSVGWAVTDLNYNILKLNGKSLWGIRLFDGGNTAEERRLHRSARRRLQRRVKRIKLLQELFSEEISKIDFGFYQRLVDSKFYEEDKTIKQPYALFCDDNYTDKNFIKQYPTIYHLRKKLINSDEKFDIRLIYLAVHHIIKYRGHFLFEGHNIENVTSLELVLNNLCIYLNEEMNIEINYTNVEKIEDILKDKKIGIKNKEKLLSQYIISSEKQYKTIIKALIGATISLSDLFDDESLNNVELSKLSFSDGKYEEQADQLSNILGDRFYCIEKLKAVYDWSILADILKGKKYISEAKVEIYEKHKKDLKILKEVVKKYVPEKYNDIFSKSSNECNYCSYIGMTKKNNKKVAINKKCSQDDLCKYLLKILKNIDTNDENYKYVLDEINSNTILPKQVTKDNGVIPYQLNLFELNIILDKASKYYDFLNKIDESGLSVKQKIINIFEFRVPYYVGPLNDAHKNESSKQCWIVKKSNEKIYPWNFNKIVDIEATAEKFIQRMTNKCTYLPSEDVLPKNSLLYSRYMVLNEINNIKINGENISVEIKQKLFNELFVKPTKTIKVTVKKIKEFLKCEGLIEDNDLISGIDDEIKSSLNSLRDFRRIMPDKIQNTEMIENIIKWIVLFGDDKKLLESRIKQVYGDILSEKNIKDIKGLKYSGWGRLSKEFLTNIFHKRIHTDNLCEENTSIISALWSTNNNLMQLLSNKFDYLQEINKFNNSLYDDYSELSYELVEKLYVSPSVKRQIWQSLVIVKELVKILGHEPNKIFLEMSRGEEEKKRTKSRKLQLLDLYKNCIEETRNWINEIDSKDESDFRSNRLYLYYTQMGKCMYSGETIDLKDLYNANIYDIDHIYPQSKVKDDSLDNKVLVKRTSNAYKSDIFPLSKDIQQKNKLLWKMLYEKKLISKIKYERLTRITGFSDDELSSFIARQIVETRQSSKAVANILNNIYKTSEIVYVKAGNVSDFRQQYSLVKVREINDFHHAKDAFLNIIVGNVFDVKFTSNPINFIKQKDRPKYNLKRMYEFDVNNSNYIAWEKGTNGTIKKVKDTMAKNNILFTRQTYQQKGAISNQNLEKRNNEGSNKDLLPIKSSDERLLDTTKYGGYNNVYGAYFILVEHTLKNKRVKTIEYVPVYLANNIEKSEYALFNYCVNNLKLQDPIIKVKKILVNSLFCIDGFYMHLTGRTNSQLKYKPAMQLCLNNKTEEYIKKIIKINNILKLYKQGFSITKHDHITREENLSIYMILSEKLNNTLYKVRLSTQAELVKDNIKLFEKLTLLEQCVVIYELLKLFQCNVLTANLKLIGGKEKTGTIVTSKNMSNYNSVKLVNQSVSGIFCNTIDILTI